jgi:hypothetical protein
MRDEHAFANIPSVRVLHHGLVADDDDYADVDLVVQIGGPFAPPAEIARLASAESGRLVETARPKRVPCVGLLADGTEVQFERLAYEDKAAQAIHAGIYDQSFVQGGLGRGRGINRIAKMLLRGAGHLNAGDMHCFYRDLFPSRDAAAQAIHRWNGRVRWLSALYRRIVDFTKTTRNSPAGAVPEAELLLTC